ncbi:probable rho GDP-dissociation inhibitor [Ylistrum balloti]|uniref:probable rho GDP-dissociation inhibitor n=1 Tax=Ylistrum balloti TaxID=509963 RepID=UPI002905E4F7|nr:probable rho GDP-dissociation inhibitor [Ylistrum balloti]XP_060076501.1 probable rho GDP-dissociation inhibitor [Ylistrum balloti]
MAESEVAQELPIDEVEIDDCEDEEPNPYYKTPEQKTMQEILEADKDDESLRNYKSKLMGDKLHVVIDKDNPNKVLINKLELHVEGKPEENISMDLKDLESLKNTTFEVVEDSKYKIVVLFHVQREIVTGLKYKQVAKRKGLTVETKNIMIGSYGPAENEQCYTSSVEEAPKGMLARGVYNMKSTFIDDDKHEYLKFEWKLEIVKKRK